MSEEKKLVPKLRFPEFRDLGEWDLLPLSSFVESLDAGVSVNSGDRPAKKGEASVLKTSAVTCGTFHHQENKVVLDEVEVRRLKEPVCKNTVIISRMNTPDLVGANAYVEESAEDIFLPDRLWAAKPKSGISMRFISYILGSDRGRAALSKIASGSSGSMKNITKPDVLSLQVTAPGFVEQQKIAACLSSLDELIAAQAREVDALKTHKEGLMQQLFPREGETQPCLRIPEFQDAAEWANQMLDGFIEEYREKSIIQDEYDVLTSARSGLVRQREYFDNERIAGRDNIGFNVIPPGYVTYRSRSDDRRFYFNENKLDISGIISTYYPVFRLQGGVNRFFIELLSHFTELVGKRSVGTSQTVLSLNELRKLKLPIPSKEEQQRIADFLTSLDDLITAAIQGLETLKAHKKGLMQQLFPPAAALEA